MTDRTVANRAANGIEFNAFVAHKLANHAFMAMNTISLQDFKIMVTDTNGFRKVLQCKGL